MAKELRDDALKKLKKNSEEFLEKVNSAMYFRSNYINYSMTFDWVNEIEFACPYIDNIIRNPRLALINEEDVVKIEKAKNVTVASVKDLAKHVHYIEKIDPITSEIKPSKILIERREETYNTYENRFIYTLVDELNRFLFKQEQLLEELETKNNKILEYIASTNIDREKLHIELKITSKELPKEKNADYLEKEIKAVRLRLKKIKDYLAGWDKSDFIQSLDKARVPFVVPPIRKTNVILKNPNFQNAMKLWTLIKNYKNEEDDEAKENLDTTGDDILKGILDDSFLTNYFVLDSISSSKKEQKEKLCKYAIVMLNQHIQKVVSILLNNGIDITEEEILNMISIEINNEKNKRLVGKEDVQKKFKNAIDEYLERIQDYL